MCVLLIQCDDDDDDDDDDNDDDDDDDDDDGWRALVHHRGVKQIIAL